MSSYISLYNLQRQFSGVTILKGITAEVLPGQVIALLGKNGAGKTTLLETIFPIPILMSPAVMLPTAESACRVPNAWGRALSGSASVSSTMASSAPLIFCRWV